MSSCFGTIAHTVAGDFVIFWGIASYSTIASILFLLGIDEFDYKEKFNPFKL